MNIRPSLRLRAIIRPSFSMKHPPSLKRTCMPCSTIWPTETKFFVMVGTCKTFLMYVWLPSLSNGTLPMCRIRWVVSSPALNITGLIRSSKVLKPFLMRHRMVRDTGVDKPYVFRIGGTSRSTGWHRIFSVSQYECSAIVFIVGPDRSGRNPTVSDENRKQGLISARVKSLDGQKLVQFLTVRANHERNRDSLRDEASDF